MKEGSPKKRRKGRKQAAIKRATNRALLFSLASEADFMELLRLMDFPLALLP